MGEETSAIESALRSFWGTREEQAERQRQSGFLDAGTRGAVTGGAHLNAVAELVMDLARDALPDGATIHTGNDRTTIPGYFRPAKKWDIVIRQGSKILGVVELKSQVGSFGNNFNNRSEEVLGNATDLQAARRHGLLGTGDPFVGYVFIIQETAASTGRSRIGVNDAVGVDAAFHGASYVDRVAMLCDRIVAEGLYSAAWAVATSAPPDYSWYEPNPAQAGFARFASRLRQHLQTA
jgi:hypothetical protein